MYPVLSAALNGLILATALTGAVWFSLRVTPRRSLNAATRYVVWWVTLAAVLLIPASSLLLRRRCTANCGAGASAPPPSFRSASTVAVARRESALRLGFSIVPTLPAPDIAPVVSIPVRPAAIPIHIPASPASWPLWPIFIWPALSLILLIRLALSYFQLSRLKARAVPLPTPRLAQWLLQCRGDRPAIRIAVSSEIATPIATGPGKPTILIPAHLIDELTEDDLDRIGLHETAHLVRRDDYALLIQRIIEAVFIPSPVILWIARRIDLEREIACDDLVIAATGRPRSYADCLTRIVESVDGLRSPWPAATAAESVSQLARRVDALLDKTRRAGAHLMKARLAAMTALLIALAFMAVRSPALIAFVTTVATIPRHAVVAARPLAAQAQAARPDELAGQVTEDKTGNPVAAAELRFHKQGMRELAADLETDRQGRFNASGLPAGQYSIEVVKQNYASTTFQLNVPSPHLTVRLIRYGIIDGTATNSAGQPLSGSIHETGGRNTGSARVTILSREAAGGALSVFREVTLEEGGHYRVFDLPPGQYAVGFWYSGQKEGSGMQLFPDTANPRFFTVAGGEEYDNINFTVVPRPSAQISGKLEIPAGVKGQFQMALGLPEQPLLPLGQVLSDKDGNFRFEMIPPGSYDLFVSGPVGGYGAFASVLAKGDAYFGRTHVQSSGQDIENLNIALAPAKSVKVMLRGQGGGPMPTGCPASAEVTLTSLEPWAILYFPAGPASAGKEQTFTNLAPGLFRVAAGGLGKTCFQTNDPVADLRADSSDPVAIELGSPGSIHGRLRNAAPDLVLTLRALNATDAESRAAYPDAAGHFVFETLPPARYRIAISGKLPGKEIEVNAGKTTEVEVTP
jgi:beta-lactamase regulating signal transducer with metallopeptidase domain